MAVSQVTIERGSRLKRLARSIDNVQIMGPLLAAPATVILLVFLAYPLLLGLWLSLTNTRLGTDGEFVGLQNYIDLLGDPVFLQAAAYSLFYMFVSELLKVSIGLGLALLLNQQFRGYRVARALMLLPWVAPTVLSALAWLWLLDPQFSSISWLLQRMGLIENNINFLGQPWSARIWLIVVNVWRGIPYFAIGYMAGLQAIPKELLEAANIDGANARQTFVRLIWPLLIPITTILVAFSAIWTITDFQLIWTITRGGPINATQVFTTLAYQRAIMGGELGEGAAVALFAIPIMVVLAFFALRSIREPK